jgi:hypothetical protein
MRGRWFCRVVAWAVSLVLLWSLPAAASGPKSGWSIQRSRNPARESGLGEVSCPSASLCIAVGSDTTAANGPGRTLAERWSAGRWTVQPTPSPRDGGLGAVWCVSGRSCIAVGSVSTSYFEGRTLAERWNGRRWRLQSIPSAPDGSLAAVSCASARACVAVGRFRPRGGSAFATLAEAWNGRKWTITPTPTPRNNGLAEGDLEGVSCVSASDCIAVGSYAYGAKSLAERWNGRRWRVQPSPNPHTVSAYKSPAQSAFDAVSCSSARACVAVGYYTPAQYAADPLVERWNGRQWMITPTPDAPNRGSLRDVSCSSASACTAVGMLDSRGEQDGAERWNGRKWTIQKTPNTYGGRLYGVSCPSSTQCTAVGGNDRKNSDRYFTLAERWTR